MEAYTRIVNELEGKAKLVVVSKKRSVEEIQRIYDLGCRDFGENRLDEFEEKVNQLPDDIRWHFIGNLQRKKVNKVLGRFHLIHSVDSFELLKKLAERSEEAGLKTRVLLQANCSGEESKSGYSPEQWLSQRADLELAGIELCGLMTMAPFTEEEAVIRACFASLAKLGKEMGTKELSMGMSNDYPIAVEEGATLVRVGSAIFED